MLAPPAPPEPFHSALSAAFDGEGSSEGQADRLFVMSPLVLLWRAHQFVRQWPSQDEDDDASPV